MTSITQHKQFIPQLRILFCIVLFEYLLFVFSGVSFSFLYGNSFFSLEADPASWIIFGLKLPQFIVTHHWIGLLLDSLIIILLLFFIRNPLNNRIALVLFFLLLLFYITLMNYLTHRNYQAGFFMIFIPFLFKKEDSRFFAYEATRYFILLFYVSAAYLKLFNGSLSDPAHFSHMLSSQFAPYFLEANTGFRTDLNLYLIHHTTASYCLYIVSFIIELSALVGFFTKRFDRLLAILLLIFHFMNWLLMDIAPFGQIGFICLLFLGRYFKAIAGSK